VKVPTFPRRAARHEHRPPAAFDGAKGIRAIDGVETHLDHVGKRRGITRAAKVVHGPTRYGGAQKWLSHAPETTKASSAGG
jgi:hypothetical protein